MLVPLFKGTPGKKRIDGEEIELLPFAGTDREGEFAQMGVGVIDQQTHRGWVWGLLAPHDIIASYRGMRIAEAVPVIGHGTLAACYYAGRRMNHPSDERYVREIEALIGSDVRQRVLDELLPSFDDAIRTMRDRGIDFSADDLETEVLAGRLENTPEVQAAVREYSDKYLLYRTLAPEYDAALKSFKNPSRINKIIARFKRTPDAAFDYVAKADNMMLTALSSIEVSANMIALNMREFPDTSSLRPGWRKEVADHLRGAEQEYGKLGASLCALASLPSRDDHVMTKFALYDQTLREAHERAHDLAMDFKGIAHWSDGNGAVLDFGRANERLAENVVAGLNRNVREQMMGIYRL